jgi:hypothetical protein
MSFDNTFFIYLLIYLLVYMTHDFFTVRKLLGNNFYQCTVCTTGTALKILSLLGAMCGVYIRRH